VLLAATLSCLRLACCSPFLFENWARDPFSFGAGKKLGMHDAGLAA